MLKPSKANIWASPDGCKAYPKLVRLFPNNKTSIAAEDGSFSHEIAECLLSNLNPSVGGGDVYDCAKLYADEVLSYDFDELHIEDEVHCNMIHPSLKGAVDCWAVKDDTIYIFDYKYSYTQVEAKNNLQCICYVAGILEKIGMPELNMEVVITIVQPRGYHPEGPIRKWVTTVNDLENHFNDLRYAASLAMSANPPARSGKHCKYCSARHVCSTAQEAAYNAIDTLSMPLPTYLPDKALSQELLTLNKAKRAIENRITGIEEIMYSKLDNDIHMPYHELQYKKGREKWTIKPEMVAELGDAKNLNLRKPLQVLTPTQARKLGLEIKDSYTKRDEPTKTIVEKRKES